MTKLSPNTPLGALRVQAEAIMSAHRARYGVIRPGDYDHDDAAALLFGAAKHTLQRIDEIESEMHTGDLINRKTMKGE